MKTQTRIEKKFDELAGKRAKGFIAYITAGDPSLDATVEIVRYLEEAGVDLVELGIPFSDPLADGKVNQDAAARALARGTTFDGVMECVSAIRKTVAVPLICYSYLNLLLAHGFERAMQKAAGAGVDGFLLLDLPEEEAEPYDIIMARNNLNHICLVAPTSPDERIKRIVRNAGGFVYCVSREGVTGAQKNLSGSAESLVARTKRFTELPVALGFGISSEKQAQAAARIADAVVVGSAIVDAFHRAPHTSKGRKTVATWVHKLVRAVKQVSV